MQDHAAAADDEFGSTHELPPGSVQFLQNWAVEEALKCVRLFVWLFDWSGDALDIIRMPQRVHRTIHQTPTDTNTPTHIQGDAALPFAGARAGPVLDGGVGPGAVVLGLPPHHPVRVVIRLFV